jgi:hypothetical protein
VLHIQCMQCGKWSVFGAEAGADPDSALQCGCCKKDHHHGQAANACPGVDAGHPGAPCPAPDTCITLTPLGEACPGGHCGLGVDGCTVCRPIAITLLSGVVVN